MPGTGTEAIIAGYMGKGRTFDNAIAHFAKAYHQQVVSDHKLMLEAIGSGRIEAKNDSLMLPVTTSLNQLYLTQ